MSIKFRVAVVSGLAVLALVVLLPCARGDEFQVTGITNAATCAAYHINCPNVSFNLDIETTSGFAFPYGPVQDVTAISGTINGQCVTNAPQRDSWLFDEEGEWLPLFADISFGLSGAPGYGSIFFNDLPGGGTEMELPNATFSYITWNATLVSTPEPSSLMLACLALAAALTGFGLKMLVPIWK